MLKVKGNTNAILLPPFLTLNDLTCSVNAFNVEVEQTL